MIEMTIDNVMEVILRHESFKKISEFNMRAISEKDLKIVEDYVNKIKYSYEHYHYDSDLIPTYSDCNFCKQVELKNEANFIIDKMIDNNNLINKKNICDFKDGFYNVFFKQYYIDYRDLGKNCAKLVLTTFIMLFIYITWLVCLHYLFDIWGRDSGILDIIRNVFLNFF